MSVSASSYINLYKFPLGRCVFALRAIAKRARELGMTEVQELAMRAVVRVQAGLDLVLRARHAPDATYAPEAVALDNMVDHTIGGMDGYLASQIRVYPGEPVALAAERVKEELFPGGVGEISNLPYPEEHERINVLLERAASADLVADIGLLPELPGMLARLRQRNDEYGEALHGALRMPTSDEVRAIQAEAQELLASTVALILGLHQLRAGTPGAVDQRAHLLEPVIQQNEALRRTRRRRRVPVDVDPDTGEEVPAGDEPGTDDGPTAEDGPADDAGTAELAESEAEPVVAERDAS